MLAGRETCRPRSGGTGSDSRRCWAGRVGRRHEEVIRVRIETAWVRVQADLAHAISIRDYGGGRRREASIVDSREIIGITAEVSPDSRVFDAGYQQDRYLARVTFGLRGDVDQGPFVAFLASGFGDLAAAERVAYSQATALARACGLLGSLRDDLDPWPTPDHDALVREIDAEMARWKQEARAEVMIRAQMGGDEA